ncbi:MAG TPA: hypothetical protein DEB46_01190, partial [Myxococcales bacterium]|nr:hypothetical protein [Myxococcales bacterium]
MKKHSYLLASLVCAALGGCTLALDLPESLSPSNSSDGGLADAGSVPCDGSAFRLDHPFAQIDGSQTIYVRSGATGDGSSAETPAGEFNAMPAGESPVVVLFAAAEAHTWNLQLDAITRPLALIGSCADTVQLEAQGAPLVHQQGGELRLARLGLSGTAGDQALIEVSATGGLSADHLSITTTGDSHGIHIEAGGDVTLQHSHFAAIGGHALSGEQAVGSWTLEDNTFLGPIGLDGISIVDFGGSGFRMIGNNQFQTIKGTALAVQQALGSWTLEDNTFRGPIGGDGISIVDFSGS